MKPAEKIDSISVHHLSGDGFRRPDGGAGDARSPVNHALDSILEMAVQLPTLRRISEELGLGAERPKKSNEAD